MLIYQVVDRAYVHVQGSKPLVRVLTIERRTEMEQEISEEEMQKLSAHPEDGVYGLCCCVNYLYNEIKRLKARTEKNIV